MGKNLKEYIGNFKNHPVLFVGTGLSLRYLKNSFTWDGLLFKISNDLYDDKEKYLDIKSKYEKNGMYDYKAIASELELEFNKIVSNDRNGKFKKINDEFYNNMGNNINKSRFKIYVGSLLSELNYKDEYKEEIKMLKKARKNIGSVITTNYDRMIEEIFDFDPLIGNDILLSNAYGAIYKIHGCVSETTKLIITENDYKEFEERYELIRAQLLSLFIHNPIIFVGYSISDDNIKKILKTIFTYVDINTPEADKIRNNFLLIEREAESDNDIVTDHDVVINETTIRINKIKTDNFIKVFEELSNLVLPVSAMDIRKVQNIVKELYAGGKIKVSITENLEELKNQERVIAIGSAKTIKYEYLKAKEIIADYFKIIEESNYQLLELIDKMTIQRSQFFPIFEFSKINPSIEKIASLKKNQEKKVKSLIEQKISYSLQDCTIQELMNSEEIAATKKVMTLISMVDDEKVTLEDFKKYLEEFPEKYSTDYRKMICYYDYKISKNN